MRESLVLITGASSGLGLAMARSCPWDPARLVNLSRRDAPGCEHVKADLATTEGWRAAAACFDRLLASDWERVVLIHSAGTLTPIGFAGEVDPDGYARQVLLNSAAPQVLGDAFLRSARHSDAPCTLLMISSGAAHGVYEGWSAYGAGKAAVDQWVRTAGAEQQRRGGRCRVLSVAPGVVATAMQEEIRATPECDFPDVGRFVELHESGALRTPEDAARDLWSLLARDDLESGAVLDLRELSDD